MQIVSVARAVFHSNSTGVPPSSTDNTFAVVGADLALSVFLNVSASLLHCPPSRTCYMFDSTTFVLWAPTRSVRLLLSLSVLLWLTC